jgi:6-phosphogluconolactonase
MKTLFLTFCLIFSVAANAQNIPLYVGTYTDAISEGIYYYEFNTKTGKLTNEKLAAKIINPSFIAYSLDKKYLYAVGEVDNYNNTKSGFVASYKITEDGTLKFLNETSSNGANPCHITLNSKNAVISNYTGGTISIHKIDENRNILPAFQVVNQNAPNKISHVHFAKFFGADLFVSNLGRDFISDFKIEGNKYVLKENYPMSPKAGPRHFEITKSGNFIYVINELNSTISILKKEDKSYINIQNISTLNKNFKGDNACAEIQLSKNEQFLYGSNRGENSIVVFKRNKKTGSIQKIQSIPVHGNWPRNFTLSPNGKFLLVANKKSKNISVFKVSKKTGILTFMYSKTAPTPVCLLF